MKYKRQVKESSHSIMQTEKECYICGTTQGLEWHHIFGASNRSKSEAYGLTVWLCHHHHNEPPNGVHFSRMAREVLQESAQLKFEEMWSHELFMKEFGRNYVG